MTSVLGFWWFPDEEAPFLDYLRKSGPLVATPEGRFRREEEIIVSDFDLVVASNARGILFTKAEYGPELKLYRGVDAGVYSPNERMSPFVSYQRGTIAPNNKLRMSNLVARASYFDERGRTVEKPIEFVKWYKRAFKWVRDRTPLWHRYESYRITERVAQAVKDGWELVP